MEYKRPNFSGWSIDRLLALDEFVADEIIRRQLKTPEWIELSPRKFRSVHSKPECELVEVRVESVDVGLRDVDNARVFRSKYVISCEHHKVESDWYIK